MQRNSLILKLYFSRNKGMYLVNHGTTLPLTLRGRRNAKLLLFLFWQQKGKKATYCCRNQNKLARIALIFYGSSGYLLEYPAGPQSRLAIFFDYPAGPQMQVPSITR